MSIRKLVGRLFHAVPAKSEETAGAQIVAPTRKEQPVQKIEPVSRYEYIRGTIGDPPPGGKLWRFDQDGNAWFRRER